MRGGTRVSKGASSVAAWTLVTGHINLTSLMIVHTLRSLTRLALGSKKRTGSLECGRRLHRRAPTDPRPKGQGGRRPRLSCTAWVAADSGRERREADWITTHYARPMAREGGSRTCERPGRAGWCRSPPRAVNGQGQGRNASSHGGNGDGRTGMGDSEMSTRDRATCIMS